VNAGLAISRMRGYADDRKKAYEPLNEAAEPEFGQQLTLDAKAEEVTTDMAGKGYVPVELEDMMPNPGVIDAAEMQREGGGTGTVALPPTIYAAPIVLSLTSTPAERTTWLTYVLCLGPAWSSVAISVVLQMTFSCYMNSAIVHVVSDDLELECHSGHCSEILTCAACHLH